MYASSATCDHELVDHYTQAVEQYGVQSSQAELAFSAIFNRYYPTVKALAGSLFSELAEDLTQQTFLRVWQRLNGSENVTCLQGLVRHSLRLEYANMMEKHFHRKQTGKAITVLSLDFLTENNPSTDCNALLADTAATEDIVMNNEIQQEIKRLLLTMPAQFRIVLTNQLAGQSLSQIAARQGWSIYQTRQYVSRGRKWLSKNSARLRDN